MKYRKVYIAALILIVIAPVLYNIKAVSGCDGYVVRGVFSFVCVDEGVGNEYKSDTGTGVD